MENPKRARQKIKALRSSIVAYQDKVKIWADSSSDNYKDELSSDNGIVKKGINDFTSKIKGKTENKKDIFSDIIDTVEGFLGTDKEDPINPKKKPLAKSKIMKYAKDSAHITIRSSKQIILDQVKNSFFGSQGACDSNTPIPITNITISPSEFDFVNVLKVNPSSVTGKIIYESSPSLGLGIQFNRKLYESFDSGTPYAFNTPGNNTLFNIQWNVPTQKYNITTLNTTTKLSDFLDDYFSSIEYPNIEGIMSNAMMLTLHGDGTEPSSFKYGMDSINRLTTKLFSICGNPSKGGSPFLNNAADQLEEDEIDIQNYFDFDDVEGIDLDDEELRKRRVLKFRDCNDFEVPINSNHMEDFTYLFGKKNIDENITNTLNKAASDAHEQSNSNIKFDAFQLSLYGSYILQIPRAIISNIMSPKIIFPIALSHKMLNNTILSVKDLLKKLYNLFYQIIKAIYWKFIQEFWKFVKKDVLNFVKGTALTILINKQKKNKVIILTLISILQRVIQQIHDGDIRSCSEIFNTILQSINAALNKSDKIPMPGILLLMANQLPGFSADRAYMDAVQRLEDAGINMGPLYGTENKFPNVIKSIIDAYSNEIDTNSYVRISLEQSILPATVTQATIFPGVVMGTGKLI